MAGPFGGVSLRGLRELIRTSQPLRRWPIAKAIMLLVFWLLLAGQLDLRHLLLGASVVLLSLAVSARLVPPTPAPRQSQSREPLRPWKLLWLPLELAGYFGRMLVDLVIANIKVAGIVLRREMPLQPVVYDYHPPVSAEWARVLLANSVTLTPGTLTVELGPDTFLVHALTADAAHGLPGWAAERRVAHIEQRLRQGAST